MRPKTWKIIYWVFLILFCLAMAYSGVSQLMQIPQGQEIMAHLGYPMYVNYIIGLAKIFGIIALLQPWCRTLKEWAFAGFAIDLIGATASFAFVDGAMAAVSMIPFLIFFVVTYLLYKKVENLPTK